MPTEAVSPSWLTISALSRRARSTAAAKLPSDDSSRYASSTLVFWKASPAAARIVSQEGLTASVGIGPNKLVAKIASDFQKPDGLTVVRPEEVQPFLDPLRIRVIPGIGPKTERFLHERHIRTVADLRTLEQTQLAEWFGRGGEDLFVKARGLSESAVSNERERKSVGEQETFEVDTLNATFVLERARALAHTVWSRLEGHGFRAFRTVTVTVRFENFITFARSRTGREVWTSEEALCAAALELLLPFLDDRENPRHRKLRLIGVRAEKLSR